jgi:serine phosphatase RsbU (regulator of sigma subunit)
MRKQISVLILFLVISLTGHAINVDSLKSLVTPSNDIDTRIKNMLNLSAYYLRSDTVQSKQWSADALTLSKSEKNVRGLILCNENYARYYTEQGRYDSALYYLETSIANYDVPEYSNEIASCYISLGNIYDIQSNYEKALDAYLLAEKKYKIKNYTHGLGLSQMGIGNIYNTTGFNQEAKIYFRRSYKNLLKTNEVYASWSMNNLATAMTELGEYDSAIFFFEKSLEIKLKNDDVYGASYTYNDLGSLYFKKKDYNKALDYYLKALESKEGLEGISKETLSNTYLDIARIYYLQKNNLSSIYYAELGLENAIACASIHYQAEAYRLLADANYKSANYKYGFEMLNQFITVKDSLQKSLYNENLADLRTKYDADQKQKEIELLNTSNKVSQLETEKANKKTQEVSLYLGGAILIILLASFLGISLFRSNRAKNAANELLQKTNDEVLHQKELVDEKNKEIMDSINYAKRIQNAILPPARIVAQFLPESFILYKPKDIVAGDFYWLETKDDKVLFAAADCTGHGVPGAMVSVICNNGLNRSVREYGITEPGKILDKTREIVIQEFEKSDDEVKDGMDISLCSINLHTQTLNWAGANNPLWIIRKDSGIIEEIKANKQPIGKYAEAKPFDTHLIQLEKGDVIYLFTDGYQDQFGGEKGKKFKASSLKELLLSVQTKSMSQQKLVLDSTFEIWRGKLEQIDDVCIIGVRI